MKAELSLNDYQKNAEKTAIYPNQGSIWGLCYTALGLGEAGEVQNKVKKILRDDNSIITDEKRLAIAKELGGNLWYIAMCAKELNYTLEEIATINSNELNKRKLTGTLQGSGDNREESAVSVWNHGTGGNSTVTFTKTNETLTLRESSKLGTILAKGETEEEIIRIKIDEKS